MSVVDLVKMIGVFEVIICQDLNLLEKQSYLCCIYGYVVLLDSEDVEICMMIYFVIKCELVSWVVVLVNIGEMVFIENGSSNVLLVCMLVECGDIIIIIVSSYIVYLLKEISGEVILLGGIYQKCSESMVGLLICQFIQQVYFSKVFIGIDGWQVEIGFIGCDMMCVDVVNVVLEKYCEVIIFSDSLKFSVVYFYLFGFVGCFNCVIIDDCLLDVCCE